MQKSGGKVSPGHGAAEVACRDPFGARYPGTAGDGESVYDTGVHVLS